MTTTSTSQGWRNIPEISDKRLKELCERIKPTVRFGNTLHYIKPVDPRNIAYTWDPKRRNKTRGLKVLRDITTYHSFGYYGLFKPSVAEVIVLIPEEDLDKVVAFEMIEHPETAADLGRNWDAVEDGYHVATTRLYIRGE